MDNMSVADIAAVTRNSGYSDGWGGFGGNGAWVLIILFAMIFGWGGNGWGNRGANGEPVTEAGLCNAMNFNNLENGVRGVQQGLCDGFYAMNTSLMNGFHGVDNSLCAGFNAVNGNITQARFDNQQCLNAVGTCAA